MDFFQKPQDVENNKIEERHVELKSNKCYNELNRLLFSSKCIYFYIVLIFASITIFFYSILAHFMKLSKIWNILFNLILLFLKLTISNKNNIIRKLAKHILLNY